MLTREKHFILAHTPTSQLGLPRPPIYIKALPAPPCPGLGFLHPQHQSLSNTQSGLLICSANPLSGTAHEGRDFCFLFADTTSAPSRVPNATFPDHLNPKVPSFGRDISSFITQLAPIPLSSGNSITLSPLGQPALDNLHISSPRSHNWLRVRRVIQARPMRWNSGTSVGKRG